MLSFLTPFELLNFVTINCKDIDFSSFSPEDIESFTYLSTNSGYIFTMSREELRHMNFNTDTIEREFGKFLFLGLLKNELLSINPRIHVEVVEFLPNLLNLFSLLPHIPPVFIENAEKILSADIEYRKDGGHTIIHASDYTTYHPMDINMEAFYRNIVIDILYELGITEITLDGEKLHPYG